jgi:hypothetical protein
MARTTIAAVVLFLLLAGGVWAVDRIQGGPPSTDTTVYVLEVKDADVQRIEVTTAQGTTAFERAEPVGWRFVSTQEAADLGRVNSVVTRLSKLRSSAKVTDKVGELSTYGLAPPADTATLTMKDGNTYRILIGGKTVNDAAYYALVEGRTELHTINTLLVGDVEKLVADPPLQGATPTVRAGASPSPADGGSPGEEPQEGPAAGGTPTPTVGLPVIRTEP